MFTTQVEADLTGRVAVRTGGGLGSNLVNANAGVRYDRAQAPEGSVSVRGSKSVAAQQTESG